MQLCRLMLVLAVVLAAYCLVVLATLVPWPVTAAVLLAVAAAARRRSAGLSAHGTARWADGDDLRRTGMLAATTGLILGRMTDSRRSPWAATRALFDPTRDAAAACSDFLAIGHKPAEPLVRLPQAVHTAVFAPTGVGKGVSCVIPFLRTCRDSVVVIDFKGENARLTAQHRREAFGHRIVLLDPFQVVTAQPDCCNPLDFIDAASPLALDDCRDLAESLVVRTGQERDPHWVDSAEVWIAAMLAMVVHDGEPGDRSLQTVRTLLTNPKKMEAVIQLMTESDGWDGMLARLGHQLTQFQEKERASTLTTTNRFLRFLDTQAVLASTRSSSFDPAALRQGRMTVYLILPPEHMRAQAALLRMWIVSLMRAVVRGGLQERNLVHFVLDEAASLGHLDVLDDAVDKFRAYGVRLQFYYQSLGQLKKCFPEGQEQTLLSNTSQVFFGVNDQPTAEYVSARLGEETIIIDSGGTSWGESRQSSPSGGPGSTSFSWNASDNWGQHGRRLLKPEEVTALPARVALTFTPGIPPLWTTLIRYYEEPSLGREPSRFQRHWKVARTVVDTALILVLAVALAAWVTVVAHEQRQRILPYRMPSGSGFRQW